MLDPNLPQSAPAQANESPARRQSSAAGLPGLLRAWMRDLIIAVAIAGFIILFLYQPVKVEGNSMQPNLEDQERIFINKFVYRLEPIAHGDVVVFRYPRDPSKSYIKRVVGVPGDRVRVSAGRVYLNGEMLREDYVSADESDLRSYLEVTVPAGTYYVMGDHRMMSNDSREFGPVLERYIYGKAVFVYWPVERAGTLR
ncbi:MAG: signal peptidase I [Nevskiales bacterium]